MKSRLYLTLVFLSALMTTGNAQNLIQNGGFEIQNPQVQTNPPAYKIFDVSGLPYWSTTASDQKVEIWSSGFKGVTTITQPDGFYPNGGSYFSELNANVVSTLYQTVTLNKTGALSYSFWHRGRDGTDTMALQIQTLINGVWTQVYYKQISTGQNWTQYEGKDVVIGRAGDQFRFNYVSVSGSTTSIGNFIDNAAFGLLAFPDPTPTPAPTPTPTPAPTPTPTPAPTPTPTPAPTPTPTPAPAPTPEEEKTSPELQQNASEGLSTQAGVADQILQQVKQLGPELYNRFALVRATRQSLFRDPVDQTPPPPSDGKEVRDPKSVTSPGKTFTATLNGNRTTVGVPEHLPWDLWGQGNGVLATAPSLGQIPGQNNAGGAFLVGIDYYLTRNLTIGLYSGYLLNRQNFTGLGGG